MSKTYHSDKLGQVTIPEPDDKPAQGHTPVEFGDIQTINEELFVGDICLGNDCEQAQAEARLIAAAPDLLAACKLTLANLAPKYCNDHLVMQSLRDAIAKAERR